MLKKKLSRNKKSINNQLTNKLIKKSYIKILIITKVLIWKNKKNLIQILHYYILVKTIKICNNKKTIIIKNNKTIKNNNNQKNKK